MGINIHFGFFVDDEKFIPTTAQLLGIAALLEEAGVVDFNERLSLEQEISAKYPDDDELITMLGNENVVNTHTDDERVLYYFPYKLTGPKSFPYFTDSFVSGKFDAQTMVIYKEARCMQPMDPSRFTRFVIAEINDPIAASNRGALEEAQDEMKQNPVLVFLRSRIEDLLCASVIVETCYM